MINFIIWLVFGALAGWVASIIMKTNAAQGTLMDIVFGIVGAMVGGWLASQFGQPVTDSFSIYGFIVAVVGACLVIFVGRMLTKAK